MNIGDFVKSSMAPFVRGTKYENCSNCERRRIALNKVGTTASSFVSEWVSKLTCRCFYIKMLHKIFG